MSNRDRDPNHLVQELRRPVRRLLKQSRLARKEVRDRLEDISRNLHDTRLVVGGFTGLISYSATRAVG